MFRRVILPFTAQNDEHRLAARALLRGARWSSRRRLILIKHEECSRDGERLDLDLDSLQRRPQM